MNEKLRNFFKQNIGYIIVLFISAIYIATAFLKIGKTGKSISQIIADGTIVFFMGIFTSRVFELQGIINGERNEKVIETTKIHGEMVNTISPYIEKLDDWCELENRKNYRCERTKILALAGLKYDDIFDEYGIVKKAHLSYQTKNKYEKKRKKFENNCISRAISLKLTKLTPGDLTSDGGKSQDRFYLGKTKSEYRAKTSLSDIISKGGLSIIFGYYGVSLVDNFSYMMLIWTALQVGLFLMVGVIKMMQAYLFIVDDYRGRIIRKIDNLTKFENYINNSRQMPFCGENYGKQFN